MKALVTHRAGRTHFKGDDSEAHSFDMVLGEVYDVELSEVRGPRVAWNSDNDEVLDIADDGGHTARITAATVGKSTITLTQDLPGPRDRLVGRFHIEVYAEPTVSVGMKFGNVRDRE